MLQTAWRYPEVVSWAPLPRWQSALRAVRAGNRRAKLIWVGDSTTRGEGATLDNSAFNGARPNSTPSRLAVHLAALGVPTNDENFLVCIAAGGASTAATVGMEIDSRFTAGAGWNGDTVYGGASGTFAGATMWTNTTTANPLSFTPDVPVDTFELYYPTASGFSPVFGTFTYDIDGGTTTTVNQNAGTATYNVVTVSAGSVGTHTCNIRRVSGNVLFCGWNAYNSNVKAVDVINAGIVGITTGGWATTGEPWSPVEGATQISGDLVLYELGINDYINSVSLASFQLNVQIFLTAVRPVSDIILFMPHPVGSISETTQLQYFQVLRQIAQINNLPLINWDLHYQSYAITNARGWMWDVNHGNPFLYDDKAQFLARILEQSE